MGRTKYNYDELEKEFIQTPLSMSIRQFARDHDDMPWSGLNAQVKARGWLQKREEFHRQAMQRAVVTAGDKIGQKIQEMRADALDVIHAGWLKMAADMQDREVRRTRPDGSSYTEFIPGQTVTPDHFDKMVKDFLLLTGNATNISEERSQSVSTIDLTGLPRDLVGAIADIAGELGSDPAAARRSPLPGGKRAGPN